MPADLSDNTRANYRSKRNRIQRGIQVGFYSEKEIPAALKVIEELNVKLGETNDTIRGPGRPRSAVKVPTGLHQSPEQTMNTVNDSNERLERMLKIKQMVDASRQAIEEEAMTLSKEEVKKIEKENEEELKRRQQAEEDYHNKKEKEEE